VHYELAEFLKTHAAYEKNVDSKNSPQERGEEKHELIEGDILDIELNRYHTKDPLGKITNDLGITLFVSSAPIELTDSIKSIKERGFGETTGNFASFTFSFFNVVRDIWHEKHHFILLDVSGEVTDLSVVKDGKLLETSSFPCGVNTVVRLIASRFNLKMGESESLLNAYYNHHLSSSERARVSLTLHDAQKQWLSFFSKELEEISPQILLPRDVFLTVDEPYTAWFKDIIESEKLHPITPTGKSFSVVALNETILAPHCVFNKGISKDPFLAIESIFLNRKIHMV
jgi:hypothetical protein